MTYIRKTDPLCEEKRTTREVARELGYMPETINKIVNAKTSAEISRIMATARQTELGSFHW